MALVLTSGAFSHGTDIPRKFTCEGADLSPALSCNEPPPGTRGSALIADDPDAPVGAWVHWVAYDIRGTARQLPEGIARSEDMAGGHFLSSYAADPLILSREALS